MSVALTKGGNVSLSKSAPNLTSIAVGLGWDARSTTGADFDLDASALLTGANGKVLSDAHFVFFNNLKSPDGSVEHTGDNLTGEGEGDDETINVELPSVPAEVQKIVFTVSIYEAEQRGTGLRAGHQRVHPRGEPGRRQRAGALRPHRRCFHRDGHDFRRGVPAGCRVEVPGRRPGVRERAARDRLGLRRQCRVSRELA